MRQSSSPQMIALGHAIRRRRRALDLSQEALAMEAGISAKHLGEIERGMRDPRATTLLLVLDALGLSPDETAAFWAELSRAADGGRR